MATKLYYPLVHKRTAGGYGDGVTYGGDVVATTDGTTTQISAIPLAEGELVHITAMVLGGQDDETGGIIANIEACARRAAAGNVTLVGTPTVRILETDASTNVTVTADTSNQTVDINVVGIAAENWRWECHYNYFKI